ncbi:MAG TPA: histidine phosphatase family protein [Dehalococcoidia bacterium]
MPRLVLIRHAAPEVTAGLAPSRWPLSAAGRQAAKALAAGLGQFEFERIYASREPKAAETARLIGRALGVTVQVCEGLHEHEREREPFEVDREAFEAKVRLLFERPGERTYGMESGEAALGRFAAAVDDIVAQAAGRDVAVVAHGTVISLYVASKCGVDGFELWRGLGTPAVVAISNTQ